MRLLAQGGLALALLGPMKARPQSLPDTLPSIDLPDIVITGTRTVRDRMTLPVPVRVVSGQAIQRTGLSRLNEVLQEQTGLLTVPDFGGGEGVQLQGLDAAYTMILIDGQPLVGRQAGTLDLSRLTVHNIERIEIIKGASSSLYGSEALAGVVNIITREAEKDTKWQGQAGYRLASFGTHDASAALQYAKGLVSLDVFANYFASQGYSLSEDARLPTVEPFHNFTFQPKVKISPSEKLSLTVQARFYGQDQDYRALINEALYSGKSLSREWNQTLLVRQTLRENWKMEYDLYATHYRFDESLRDAGQVLFEENLYRQWFYRPEVRTHYKMGHNTLTAGVGMNYETLQRTLFSETARLQSEYFFAQFEWFIRQKWNILLGFRYDHHHQYQSQLSPKLGFTYEVQPHLFLKASLGYGYKAPDLRQLYLDFTNSAVGYSVFGYNVAPARMDALEAQGQLLFRNALDFSAPLRPESSLNLNLGGSMEKNRLTLDVNFFYNQMQNLIDTRAVAQRTNGQNVFSYFNLNRLLTYGLEVNAQYRVGKYWTFSAGYQFLEAQDRDVLRQLEEGQIFARDPNTLSSFRLQRQDYFGLFNRSRHLANFKINFEIPKWKTNLATRLFYRSRYGLFDRNQNQILDEYDEFVKGYCLLNMTLSQEFRYGFLAQIGVNNLLDFTDPVNISNVPGRQWLLKVAYSF